VTVLTWIAAGLCVLQGGYMVADGTRALVTGGYFTPRSGEHAGRLGPWADLVRRAGVLPESTGMKATFVVLGVPWLAVAAGLAAGAGWAWVIGFLVSILTLWYLVPGTVISLLVLVLLLVTGGS
jgi:hypothetical protein